MTVQKRYQMALETKLDQLWHQGFTVFERWELLAWFDKERLTNVVWRDIQERWLEMFDLKKSENKLSVIKCDETTTPQTFIVIQADRSEKMSDLAQ